MLDTNICIYTIRRKPWQVVRRLQRIPAADVGISSITLSELTYGVYRSGRPEQNRVALVAFLAPFEILPYDDMAAQQYGELRSDLEGRGTPIGSLDTLIAAHACSIDCTLVTNNTSEFNRVPKLRIENWAA